MKETVKTEKMMKAFDELSMEEFDAAMAEGLRQAKANQSAPVDEVFDRMIDELLDR